MSIDNAIMIIGPVTIIVNVATLIVFLRPKYGVLFTIGVFVATTIAGHIQMMLTGMLDSTASKFMGVMFIPLHIWLFRGQVFQKIFVFFLQHQIVALETFFVEMLVAITVGPDSSFALPMFLGLCVPLLGVHMTVVFRHGRRLFERIFKEGRRLDWALYALGSLASYFLVVSIHWTLMGPWLYTCVMLFILWGNGMLCYTIINAHEKAAQTHTAETLLLQVEAMREQTDADKKHRSDMDILRHDMRHEAAVIMELFRTGKQSDAEAVYANWQASLFAAAPVAVCAEPVLNAAFTRAKRRAQDMNIRLDVYSDILGALPVDTVKLSVILSNALENALTEASGVQDCDRRAVSVKLLLKQERLCLEIAGPCGAPVELDGKGLPMSQMPGHGIGARAVAAFAEENDYPLEFSFSDGILTMRLEVLIKDTVCV